MSTEELAQRLIASRCGLGGALDLGRVARKSEAEGGCGVIGIACSVQIPGRHLLRALSQMRNRGNGKGGGVALVGLSPAEFGVSQEVLRDNYLLTLAYLDATARTEVEKQFVEPLFIVDQTHRFPQVRLPGVEVAPPEAVSYFVRIRTKVM